MTVRIRKLLPLLLLLAALPACQGTASSPQTAAINMLLEGSTQGMVVDQATLTVRQTIDMDTNHAIVVLAFDAAESRSAPVTCLYTYQTLRRWSGWMTANGGGVCQPDRPEQPQGLHMSTGHYPGQRPKDPGYTQVYGFIQNPQIVKVRITWNDNQISEAAVVNGTAFSIRNGDSRMKAAEGLDKKGQVIETVFADPQSMAPLHPGITDPKGEVQYVNITIPGES